MFPQVALHGDQVVAGGAVLAGRLLRWRFLIFRPGNKPVDLAYPVDLVPQSCLNPPDKPNQPAYYQAGIPRNRHRNSFPPAPLPSHYLITMERDPRERDGSRMGKHEPASPPGHHSDDSALTLTGRHESLRRGAAFAVTTAPRTTLTSHSWPPFMITEDLQSARTADPP